MARWRHLLFDVVTRAPQLELLAVGGAAQFGEVLDSPGSAQVSISIIPQAGLTKEMLDPPRAIYAVEKDDELVWAGPIITHQFDIDAGTMTLGCEGYWNYVRRRNLTGSSLVYTGVEQMQIAKNLIDWMQTFLSFGDLGIDASGFTASGVTRDRTYNGFEHPSIGKLIEDLSAIDGGFDFRLYPRWSAGPNSSLNLRLDFIYPAVGRVTNVALDLAANAVTPDVKVDSSNLANEAIVEGAGTGQTQLSNISTDAVRMAANGIRLDTVESRTDVTQQSTLLAYAKRALARGKQPITVPRVEVSADLLGELIIGDQVRVIANVGLLDLDEQFRITRYTVDVGSERMTLELAPLAVFLYG